MKRILTVSCLVALLVAAAAPQPAASTAPQRIEITARRFSYTPETVTLKEGQPVLVVLKSADATHGLRLRELGLDMKASKDKPAEALVTPLKTGDFVGHCSVFCGVKHGTMKITFHVVQ